MSISIYERLRNAGNGMVNTFELQGRLLDVNSQDKSIVVMTSRNDTRRAVTIEARNINFRNTIKIDSMVRVNGFIRGSRVETDDGRSSYQLRFRAISVRDCLDLSHFGGEAERQWREESGFRVEDKLYQTIQLGKQDGNFVRIQGFLEALYQERGSERSDGLGHFPAKLHVFLRQFESMENLIPMRLYGNNGNARKMAQNIISLYKQSRQMGRRIALDAYGRVAVNINDYEVEGVDGDIETVTEVEPIIKLFNVRVPNADDQKRLLPHEHMVEGAPVIRDLYPWATENTVWEKIEMAEIEEPVEE